MHIYVYTYTLIYSYMVWAFWQGGGWGRRGKTIPWLRAEYALSTRICTHISYRLHTNQQSQPANPKQRVRKPASPPNASKQASHSKQASQRTTYNTMKSVMAASTCTMRCHKSSNSIQFTIQTQQLRILLNALFTHLSSVYYADRSLLCTPLVRLVHGGGAYILIFAMAWSFSNFISTIYACISRSFPKPHKRNICLYLQ